MISSSKKLKRDDASKKHHIHSGSFMTSYLHDDNTDYNNDMPIASPDSLSNEVGINDLNNEDEEIETKVSKQINAVINIVSQSGNNSEAEFKYIKENSKNPKTTQGTLQRSSSHSRSISGGLTLNKTNKSLKNLIYYIKSAYSNNLNSPKWKNFKGLKLQVVEKIRLNNVIWRTWFDQYGSKNLKVKKKTPPLLLAINVDEPKSVHNPKMAILEGEYWKRRLGSITNEYKKWRTISRQHVHSHTKKCSKCIIKEVSEQKKSIKQQGSNTDKMTVSNSVQINDNAQFDKNVVNNSKPNTNIHLVTTNSYNVYSGSTDSYNSINSSTNYMNNSNNNFMNSSQINNVFYDNNNNASYSSNHYLNHEDSYNTNNNVQQNYIYNNNLNITENNIGQNNNQQMNVLNPSNYVHPPISSKQVPFTNRCRSPSPGLFGDIDMFNFSSDTLFGTNYLANEKDHIFGNNPDLFQPDLMHLYPNFDFLDLDYEGIGSNTQSNNSNSPILSTYPESANHLTNSINPVEINHSQKSQQSSNPNLNSNNDYSASSYSIFTDNNNEISKKSNNNNDINKNPNKQVAILYHQPPPQFNNINNQNIRQQNHVNSTDNSSSDLYNFNTLATAAAALSNISDNNNNDKDYNRNTSLVQKSSSDLMSIQNKNNVTRNGRKKLNINEYTNNKLNSSKLKSQNINKINNVSFSGHTNEIDNSENDLQISLNGSSNTIRNLLAQQSPQPQGLPINNNYNTDVISPIQSVASNIMPSTGVYSHIAESPNIIFPHQQQNLKQQSINIYSTSSNLNSLISNNHITTNHNTPSTSNSKHGNDSLNDNSKYSNHSSLLSAVLAPSIDHSSQQPTVAASTLSPSKNNLPLKKAKRSRKISIKLANEMNSTKDSDTEQPQNKKSTKQKVNNKTFKNSSEILNDYMNHPNHQKLNNMIEISNEKNSTNIKSSPKGHNIMINSNEHFSRYNNSINSESNNDIVMSKQANNQRSDHLATSANNVYEETPTPISRSRSSSVTNTAHSDQGTTAEQKRRCNIQNGFDRLQTLVPSLKDPKNSKASKATMLKKTYEYIKELKLRREKRLNDLSIYQREIEELSNKVTECQIQLPATGVSVSGSLNKTEVFEGKFRKYVQDRTVENWKFYLFSIIIKPLFENFITTLNTSSKEDMERTFYQWQERHCNLIQLRPIVSNYLRQISKTTSILTDSKKLPEECYVSALTKV